MEQPSPRTYTVHARSSDVFGRVLCNARNHHFVVDGPAHNGCPGEELTPAEIFLSGVAACGVELVQVIAKELSVNLKSVRVELVGLVDRNNPVRPDLTVFNEVKLRAFLIGVSQEMGTELVQRFTRRCPLFGTVAAATPNLLVEVECSD